MNEIEQQFNDAFCKGFGVNKIEEIGNSNLGFSKVCAQFRAGIYIADFAFFSEYAKFIIEIDGQESHKTKEQRFNDYQRERFFQKKGFIIIRFMGSEVFVNAEKCVKEAFNIMIKYMSNIVAYGIKERQEENPSFLAYPTNI